MKIAFIGQKGIPANNGGVEKYVESLALNLIFLGQEVLVYNRRDYLPEKLLEFKGIQIINKPYLPGKNFASITHNFLAIIDLLLSKKIDVIHFQGIGPSLLIWLPKLLRPKIKIVATFHSFDYYNQKWNWGAKLMLHWGEQLMCRYSDHIIALTSSMQDYIKLTYQRESIVIPNGANLYKGLGSDKILSWGLNKNNYIISVSRLIELKGLQYLIRAFKKLKTDKKLVIVGEGEYLPELEKLAATDERIIFTDNQKGKVLDQLYANAYLFVQASQTEGLSISLLEAMAHKTACLVSDITANKQAIGNTGFTFISKNSLDLQDKLHYLLANPEIIEKKALATYERIKEKFTWSKVVQKILDVYRK